MNMIVLCVRSKKLDVGRLELVIHRDYQPIAVASYIKHHAVVGNDGCLGELRLDLLGGRPGRLNCLGIPRAQAFPGGRMRFGILLNCALVKNSHEPLCHRNGDELIGESIK